MVEKELTVTNPSGLHTRPAKKFVDAAKTFSSVVTLVKGDKEGDGKNLIKVMKLGISLGNTIRLRCEGEDENEALESLEKFLETLTE